MISATSGASRLRFEIPRAHTVGHARELRSRVEQALEQGNQHLIVDAEGWSRLDVTMLSSLIRCASACRARGASFEVANVSVEMKEQVRALSLNERVGFVD
jgi:anti-anti-sigma regulatory factor